MDSYFFNSSEGISPLDFPFLCAMIKTIAAKSIGLFFNTTRYVAPVWTAHKLFDLFCTPLSGGYKKVDRPFIQSAMQYQLATSQDQITYHHWVGSGKKVLFIHGWESNTARWRPYVETLQDKGLDIYSIDAPAQGMSAGSTITVLRYAEAIDLVVQNCQPDIIIGHSLGGMAAGYYLRHYQHDIQELVLLSTPSGLSDMMYRYFDILSLTYKMMPHLNKLFLDQYDIQPDHFSTASHLSDCTLNGIIIHDQTDDITPYPESLEVNDLWANGVHIATSGLGHSLKDDRIIKAICDYISDGVVPNSVGINT